ncbi:hypothetical protein ACFLU6_06670 [Acidobacteriota bacterium]
MSKKKAVEEKTPVLIRTYAVISFVIILIWQLYKEGGALSMVPDSTEPPAQ